MKANAPLSYRNVSRLDHVDILDLTQHPVSTFVSQYPFHYYSGWNKPEWPRIRDPALDYSSRTSRLYQETSIRK